MTEDSIVSAMAELTAAVATEAEAARPPLLFEGGEIVLARLRRLWPELEGHELLASEDKVTAQVGALDEATASLWHLHKALVAARRQRQRDQRDLQRRA
jgi:hypothetical protein